MCACIVCILLYKALCLETNHYSFHTPWLLFSQNYLVLSWVIQKCRSCSPRVREKASFQLPMHLLNVKWVNVCHTNVNVCHTNKCCKSNSPKQYKTTDFSPKNNNLGNTGSIATSSSFFPVDMEPVLPRLLFLGEKCSVLILLWWVTLATFICVTYITHLTFSKCIGSGISDQIMGIWSPMLER